MPDAAVVAVESNDTNTRMMSSDSGVSVQITEVKYRHDHLESEFLMTFIEIYSLSCGISTCTERGPLRFLAINRAKPFCSNIMHIH